MSYRKGDLRVVTQEECGDGSMPIDNNGGDSNHVEGFPYAALPHSCGEWIVGTAKNVRWMIEDLKSALASMEPTE
jgi:hypothetical protein